MSLIILSNSVSCSNPIASYSTRVYAKRASTISITSISDVLVIHIFKWLTSMMLLSIEIIHCLLSSIALSNVLHEVSIVHSISHLSLIMSSFVRTLWIAKSTYSGLIEHLLFLIHLSINMWQHFMNSWVISWLEQNTMVGCIHFIDAQRSIACSIASSLLSHSVSHEKCLIWFLGTKPINRKMINYIRKCLKNTYIPLIL